MRNKTRTTDVLVLTEWTTDFYFGSLLHGMAHAAAGANGHLVVLQTVDAGMVNDGNAHPTDVILPLAWDHIDAFVSVAIAAQPAYLNRLRAAGKSVALTSHRDSGFSAPVARPDNFTGAQSAVQHLLDHGHRDIGFVGNLVQLDMRERYNAYHESLVANEIEPDPRWFFPASDNMTDGGVRAAEAFLHLTDRPTALVIATDQNALGFIRTVQEAGLEVPRDVAVIGYDNIEESAFSTPTLATVSQQFEMIGALAAQLALAGLDNPDAPAGSHSLPSHVVARESCGCGRSTQLIDATVDAGMLRAALLARLDEAILTDANADVGRRPIADGVALLERTIQRLLTEGVDELADLFEAVNDPLLALVARPEVLQEVDAAVTQYLHGLAACLPDDAREVRVRLSEVQARISADLRHLQTGTYLGLADSVENALAQEHRISHALLRHGSSDPRRLGWLEGTDVRLAMLAVWQDDELVVTGVHDPEARMATRPGTATTPQAFPPRELIDASDTAVSEVVFVIPVRANGRDWGLLAVVGPIRTRTRRETYNHWASLLCTAFEQEASTETLRSNEERHGLLASAMNEGLWEWDAVTRAITVSDRCCELLHIDRDALGTEGWQSFIHADDVVQFREALSGVARGDLALAEVEHRFRVPGEQGYRWLLTRAIPLGIGGQRPRRLLGSIGEIDDRKRLEERLRQNALYDAATQLPNRRLFLERLTRSLERWRSDGVPFAVVFLDLDRFKVVNDSLGHQVGDRLLSEVSERLRSTLRPQDTAARFGGDEFAVLLDDIGPDDAPAVARRIQASLARPVEIDGHSLWVTASMGVASSAVDYTSAEDVLRDADAAMYHAKQNDPGTVSFFDDEMHERALRHIRLQAAVQDALDRDEFVVHYQPIVSFSPGGLQRFEALVRWQHPDRGLLLPAEFLPLMEETGLIVRLGRWILDDVCRQIAQWQTQSPALVNVSVNVSDREFWHAGLVDHVLGCLERHSLSAASLTLEITEGVIMRRPEMAQHIMDRLHGAGLRLHIDDFGAGHSSLQTLHRFPVEALKIDRSFISTLFEGSRSRELVRAIVAMGDALGLEVIAEGIETADQLALLRTVGCTLGQGFLFDRAVAPERVRELLGHPFVVADQPRPDDLPEPVHPLGQV